MVNQDHHWLISTYQLCPLTMAQPSYVRNGFKTENKPSTHKMPMLSQPIDHLIREGLSVNDIIKQMDLTGISQTRARQYIYERKRFIGYRRKSRQMEALELMKDKKLTDADISKMIGMDKRYIRYLRVENSRGRL